MSTFKNIIETLNSTVSYIEENLGVLTSEEYICTGQVALSGNWYTTYWQDVIFDRIFIEPPTVSVTIISNPSGDWKNPEVSNITTSGCSIGAYIDGGSTVRSCVVQYQAIGLVRKQS